MISDIWRADSYFNTLTTGNPIKINVVEYDKHFAVSADLPGIYIRDVTTSYDTGLDTLTITVKTVDEQIGTEEVGFDHIRERFTGAASRSIRFKHGVVDSSDMQATQYDGVLYVELPKHAHDPSVNASVDIEIVNPFA
jgi:HSP20 family molecular chaperone IbpA